MDHLAFEGEVWNNWFVQELFFSLASGADNFLGENTLHDFFLHIICSGNFFSDLV